jgi:tetratricopeptide (TPR) repeat protein
VLLGLGFFYFVRTRFEMSYRMGGELIELGRRGREDALLAPAYYLQGLTEAVRGEFETARAHHDQSIDLYDANSDRSAVVYDASAPGVGPRIWSGFSLTLLGYPDQGLQKTEEAVARARQAAGPFSLAFAISHVAWVHHARGSLPATREHADRTISISTEHGFPFYAALGMALKGWALSQQIETLEEGVSTIEQGLAAWRATGAEVWSTWFLAVLAEAYWKFDRSGRRADGARSSAGIGRQSRRACLRS